MAEDPNPYSSPEIPSIERQSKSIRPMTLHLFFFINFSIAVLLACLATFVIIAPQSPFDVIGGAIMLLPTLLYAVIEWRAWHLGKRSLYRILGVLNTIGAVFIAFGIATNLFEEPQPDSAPPPGQMFWLWFLVLGVSMFGYLLASGVYRLQFAAREKGNIG